MQKDKPDYKDLLDLLVSLFHLDVDATRAYGQAIENCDDNEVRAALTRFRADHERHVNDLSELISRYGGTPPERKPDMKGFFIEGFTAIRSMTGTKGALAAMRRNEKLTTSRYDAAVARPNLPADVVAVLRKNADDERRHLAWIEAHVEAPANV